MNAPAPRAVAAVRRWPWLVWAMLVALALVQVVRTPVLTDVTAFLPGPADAGQRLLAGQLRDGVAARLILIGLELPATAAGAGSDEAATVSALARAALALREQLAADDAFEWVAGGASEAFERDRQAVFDARWLLVDEDLGPPSLARAFERLQLELRSAGAPLVRTVATGDPTLASLRLLASLGGPGPLGRDGAWFTDDLRIALLVAQTHAPGFELDAQQQAIERLRAHADRALADWPSALPRPQLALTGPGVFGVASREAIERDATRLSIAATVAIALLLGWVLRSVRVVALAALPVGSGVLAGIAAAGAVWGSVHGITLGFGITLIGEAVDYAIYAWVQRRPDGRAQPQLWRGVALAVATSAAGFAAMFFSGFQGLAQLGVFSVTGIVVAGACARWLLPPLLPAAPPAPSPRTVARLAAVADAARALRWPVAAAGLAAAALLVARGESLWDDDLAVLSPLPAAVTDRDGRLRDALGLPDLRLLLALRGANLDDALAQAERLAPRLDALREAGRLRAWESPATLVPSHATQQARRDALPDAETLRDRVAEVLAGTNLRPQAFEPFVRSVDAARVAPPIAAAHYDGTALGRRLAAQLFEDRDGATALVLLRGVADPPRLAAELRALPQAAPDGPLQVLDLKDDVRRLVADYRARAQWVALAGLAAIVLMLSLQVRSPRGIVAVAASLGAGCALTGASLVLLYNSLTLFHLVALLLVAGVGSNYVMFCSALPAHPSDRASARLSVLLCAGSTFVAFALLASSDAPVLRMIGTTVAIGVVATLLAGLAFAPATTPRPAERVR